MGNQFCTSCGHVVALDARFCDNCGAVFVNAGPPELETVPSVQATGSTSTKTTREVVVERARFVVGAWVMPFNATLIFGSTVVAVFDFLSPRVALLPIAATVAVVGLLAALALRKFVAPSLPEGSAFKRALAPELGVHRSPVLIATGLLSALMVTGAAWSSAASTSGGVIASKFDAARNAQMQLGVLQGVQKEQRVQTAVLEDIREGRTLNPRRELANQGILWTSNAFHSAVQSGDKSVVSLFLAGGMKWRFYEAKSARSLDSDAVLVLLLDNPQLLEREEECWSAIVEVAYKKIYILRESLKRDQQRVPSLKPLEVRFMKAFCTKPTDLAFAVKELKSSESHYAEKVAEARTTDAVLGPAAGTVRTTEVCTAELSANGGSSIQKMLSNYITSEVRIDNRYGKGIFQRVSFDLNPGEKLLNRAKANGSFLLDAKGRAEIDAYCQSDRAKKTDFDNFESEMLKQVLAVLN